MNKTNIEYLDYSWNPLAMRCTPVSEGCVNCWHIKMADRLAKNPSLSSGQRNAYAGGFPMLLKERLDDPLKRKKPSIIGVQFMGDLFHKDVSYRQIGSIFFEALRNVNNHTYLFLTKRPQRMADFIKWYVEHRIFGIRPNFLLEFPYIWLGITAENQQRADERIPILLQIPAAKRFVSIEPMLGSVNLCEDLSYPPFLGIGLIDWVIVGGESGPGARPVHPDWVRSIRDQCDKAGVDLFFKQWGEWFPGGEKVTEYDWKVPDLSRMHRWDESNISFRIGKKRAGRFLDGQEWNQGP